jgi:hypothetical protein
VFGERLCLQDWTYTHILTLLSLGTAPSKIEIIPHPGLPPAPTYQFINCCYYPIEPCIYLTPLYVCWTPNPLGVEQTNWGAIKNLF